MKSCKRTNSLSALLILMLALTVPSLLFIRVSMPSSLSVLASPDDGNITYDMGANVITIIGYTSSTPCTFTDIWNADQAGGWGQVSKQGDRQFIIYCNLQIGDGSTATWLKDVLKQVVFTGIDNDFLVKNNAHFTLGEKDGNGYGHNGCHLIIESKEFEDPITEEGCEFNLYASYFYWVGTESFVHIYLKGDGELFDSIFETSTAWAQIRQRENDDGYAVRNLICIGFIWQLNAGAGDFVGVPDDWTIINSPQTAFQVGYGSNPITIKNLKVINAEGDYGIVRAGHGQVLNLVNAELEEPWDVGFWGGGTPIIYRQYTFNLHVVDLAGANLGGVTVTLKDKDDTQIFSVSTAADGTLTEQTVTRGYYDEANGDTLQDYGPHTLIVAKLGYQTYSVNFTLSQKINWMIALQPISDDGLIERAIFVPVDPDLTSPSGTYRWLDVANQAYGIDYRNSYNYSQATVEVAYSTEDNKFRGLLKARNLKPNFAYQLKLVGTPGTADNERIGLVGRWWQEEWTGTTWSNGQNLNNKGDGSSPNPNDQTYLSRCNIQDSSSPTGYHYRYTGYLVFNYFITDSNGTATLQFETGSCYHVIWKTTQRSNATNDGPVKTVTFNPDSSQPVYDIDYPRNTVSIFGEWERLPMSQVDLQLGEYNCQIVLTEESFHGNGGTFVGNWAGAVTANIVFTVN